MKGGGETFPSAEPRARVRAGRSLRAYKSGGEVSGANFRLTCSSLLEKGASLHSRKSLFRDRLMNINTRKGSEQHGDAVSAEREFSEKRKT